MISYSRCNLIPVFHASVFQENYSRSISNIESPNNKWASILFSFGNNIREIIHKE